MSPFRLLCLSRTGTCLAAMAYAGPDRRPVLVVVALLAALGLRRRC